MKNQNILTGLFIGTNLLLSEHWIFVELYMYLCSQVILYPKCSTLTKFHPEVFQYSNNSYKQTIF